MGVKLQASTGHLFFAGQTPDATRASLPRKTAKTEGRKASEVSPADDKQAEC